MASVTSDSGGGSLGLGIISPDASPAAAGYVGTGANFTSQEALKHVLDHVFCLGRDSGLRQSLQAAGYLKISQVISMSSASMKALSHKAKVAGVVVNVNLLLSEEEFLTTLQGFARFKHNQLGRPLTPVDWSLVTEDEFDEYQGSYHMNPGTPHTPTPTGGLMTPPPSNVSQPTAPPPMSEVASFRRGIKRDQSLFPVLKDEKDWDDWQRRLRTQATAQGVENVLDPYYCPAQPDYAFPD